MIISKRKYYCIRLLTAVIVGVLILIGALIANRYYFQIKMIDKICIYSLIAVISIIAVKMMIAVILFPQLNLELSSGIRSEIRTEKGRNFGRIQLHLF